MDWGPHGWKFLHYVTFAYPTSPTVEQQRAADAFFGALGAMLPCDACQVHYASEVAAHPPDTRSQATLSAWLVDLHNRVNARLNKGIVPYADAERMFSSQCTANCGGRAISKSYANGEIYFMILLLIAGIALIYITRRAMTST